MMLLETTRFGTVEVDESTLIELPDGLPGFPGADSFALLDIEEGALYWMQSIGDNDLAFLVAVPWDFFPDYDIVLDDFDEEALGVHGAADLIVLNLLSVQRESEAVTANLLAPILVNKTTRVGRQIVLKQDLPTRAPFGASNSNS